MKYSVYANRPETDKFFVSKPGTIKIDNNEMIKALRWVEKKEYLDPKLWTLFVNQYRIGDTDDCNHGWRGEYWGKMMRGAVITYQYTQDEELYRVLDFTVRDLLTTADKNGRITSYSSRREFRGWDMWIRKYVMLGLEYFLDICKDDALSDAIIKALMEQADYIYEKVANDYVGKLRITNTSEAWGGVNSSSILEPFVKLYNLTGAPRYFEFSKEIIEAGGSKFIDIFETELEGKVHPYELPVTKAYEMISCFEGILEFYRVTEDKKYLKMCLNFADLVKESDITIIGSAGTTHELFDNSIIGQFDESKSQGIMQETCVTVTWMKFCMQLLMITGDSKYADFIETSAFNGLLGSINFNENPYEGEVFPFDSYSPLLNSERGKFVGGYMNLCGDFFHWGCCVAIGGAGTGLIPAIAKMTSKTDDIINFYFDGEYDFEDLTVNVETKYPYEGTVKCTFENCKEEKTLKLRIPSWSKKTVVTLSGEKIPAKAGKYLDITKKFTKKDVLLIDFDMAVKPLFSSDIDKTNNKYVSFTRGPIVLARDGAFEENVMSEIAVKAGKIIKSEIVDAPSGIRMAVKVKADNGDFLMYDYASCGQNWKNGKKMTAWMTLA